MDAMTRRRVKGYLHLSWNEVRALYNYGSIEDTIYYTVMFLTDKLNYRSVSAWQDEVYKKYGFSEVTRRINLIRKHWGFECDVGGNPWK